MIEDDTEIRWSRQVDAGVGRELRVMGQHAGVVEQFVPIDARLGYVFEAPDEELKCLPMIRREQLMQQIHDPSWLRRRASVQRILGNSLPADGPAPNIAVA